MFGTTALCVGGKVFLFPGRTRWVVKIPAAQVSETDTDTPPAKLAQQPQGDVYGAASWRSEPGPTAPGQPQHAYEV
jgi:hypothetical protein